MVKFSMVVPVYNTELYLEKCLASLVGQKDFDGEYEIIVVNDGSTDESEKTILEFQTRYPHLIQYIKKEHQGVSVARNTGIQYVSGDYILFVDSDDYLDLHLLKQLESHILEQRFPEVIKINSCDVCPNGKHIKDVIVTEQEDEIELLKDIMQQGALEVPWGYVYQTEFYKNNHFEFSPNRLHEDYGLIPLILDKASSITCLPYIGYHYVVRDGSIMRETEYEKIKERVDDVCYLFSIHMREIECETVKGKLLRSYSLEAMLSKLAQLNHADMKQKLQEIKGQINQADIYCYNPQKVIKKTLLGINVKAYLGLYRRYKLQVENK